jgi:hypothetical protein
MLAEMKKRFREYAPDDQVPLAGYVGAMLVYVGMLSAALVLTRKSRFEPGGQDLALLGLGTHKLSRIVTKDFVTAPLRAPFTERRGSEGASEVHDEPRGGALRKTIGIVLTCPYCFGLWLSTGLGAALLLRPAQTRFVLRALAALTVSDFLNLSYSRLNEDRKTVLAERQRAELAADIARKPGEGRRPASKG